MVSEQVGLGLGFELKRPWKRSRFPGMGQCLPVGGLRASLEAGQCAISGVLSEESLWQTEAWWGVGQRQRHSNHGTTNEGPASNHEPWHSGLTLRTNKTRITFTKSQTGEGQK